jgi:hypothetical protein
MLLRRIKDMSKLSQTIQGEFKALLEFFSFNRHRHRRFPSSLFMDDFEPVAETGFFRHRHKAGMFCGVCVPAHRVYGRMNKGHGGWTCFTCGQWYADTGGLMESAGEKLAS